MERSDEPITSAKVDPRAYRPLGPGYCASLGTSPRAGRLSMGPECVAQEGTVARGEGALQMRLVTIRVRTR